MGSERQIQAAVMDPPGEVVIRSVTLDAPARNEVIVRTAAAGVCHSDLHYLRGRFPHRTPVVLGHEASGVVEEVGGDVTDFAPGDHVVTCLSVFCGHCEFCISGRPALCDQEGLERGRDQHPRASIEDTYCAQFASLGSFAEAMLVHENALVKIPVDVPLEAAALLGCSVLTGVDAVLRTAAVTPGSSVAVIGCGGVGLNCIQGAVLAGADRILAIDRSSGALELAARFGATDLVDASNVDPVARVRELLPSRVRRESGGVDYSFEAIGKSQTAEQAFAMLRKGGSATLVGMLGLEERIDLPAIDFLGEKRLQGSRMGSNRFRLDIPHLANLYRGGRLNLDELISGRIGLAEVEQALAALEQGQVARSVVIFG